MSAPSDVNEITISSSPHFSVKMNTRMTMLAVILALLPLAVFGIVKFGLNAAMTIIVSVTSCVVFEYCFQKFSKRPVRTGDLSAIVTGLMLAMVLPPDVPMWMTILGAFFAIVVAKEFFGGIGSNVFNPALTGRAFMFVSFPVAMTTWTKYHVLQAVVTDAVSGASTAGQTVTYVDALSSATPLVTGNVDYLDLFLGNATGCIGEVSALIILIMFVILACIRIIDWRQPVFMVGTVALGTWIAGGDVLYAVLSGGLLFGAVFMATDYATAPVTPWGRAIFGAGCGLITFLIRQFGGYPEGVMFSILIMNVMVPFLNRIMPTKYGYGKKGGKK